jgi:hypothetical protein
MMGPRPSLFRASVSMVRCLFTSKAVWRRLPGQPRAGKECRTVRPGDSSVWSCLRGFLEQSPGCWPRQVMMSLDLSKPDLPNPGS